MDDSSMHEQALGYMLGSDSPQFETDTAWDPGYSAIDLSELTCPEEELKRRTRAARLASLPDEDKGLVYWEDWCTGQGLDTIPTWELLTRYADEFVVPMEENLNRLAGLDPTVVPICATKVFVRPVLRLWNKMRQIRSVRAPTSMTLPMPSLSFTSWSGKRLDRDFESSVVQTRVMSPPLIKDSSLPTLPTTPSRSPTPTRRAFEEWKLSTPVAETYEREQSLAEIEDPTLQTEPFQPTSLEEETAAKTFELNETDRLEIDTANRPARTFDIQTSLVEDAAIIQKFKAQEIRPMKPGYEKMSKLPFRPASPVYILDGRVKSLWDILEEWRFGFKGGPAIQDINSKYNARWWETTDKANFECRAMIVKEFVDLVILEGYSEVAAFRDLETLQGLTGVYTLADAVRVRRENASRIEKRQSVNAGNGSGSGGNGSKNENSIDSENATSVKRRKATEPTTSRTTVLTPAVAHLRSAAGANFPYPIRDFYSIENIWKEWTIGWSGEPSIESLMQTHGKVWKDKTDVKLYRFFYYKDRYVNTVKQAVASGVVDSAEDAIQVLDGVRGYRMPATFLASPEYKDIVFFQWGLPRGIQY
ncbi:hypothetical protein BGZ83_005336 [Gryganskiella cystojenkinii]|nr:hypothetical protein BGZ83_005336 [Gryganskiella cystojenkinii]